jgi:hypothetical protein
MRSAKPSCGPSDNMKSSSRILPDSKGDESSRCSTSSANFDEIFSSYSHSAINPSKNNSTFIQEAEMHLDHWMFIFRKSILEDYQRLLSMNSSNIENSLVAQKATIEALSEKSRRQEEKIKRFDEELEYKQQIAFSVFFLFNKVLTEDFIQADTF